MATQISIKCMTVAPEIYTIHISISIWSIRYTYMFIYDVIAEVKFNLEQRQRYLLYNDSNSLLLPLTRGVP